MNTDEKYEDEQTEATPDVADAVKVNEEASEPALVTKETVLGDIEDMLGRMGNAPGVDNVKVMIAELKDLN